MPPLLIVEDVLLRNGYLTNFITIEWERLTPVRCFAHPNNCVAREKAMNQGSKPNKTQLTS
jgi:hypothetical protein